ncbi:ABC transporter substrate-binding protein [Streptomyces sp. XD-27]|uniref:ABC transporter substrate-binding protein n=1 Tax=Streptomyces sp. XD-27 TaxID=3062779 RepID=UPI0026F4190D|nr:ABC transporter substrate-binding protein [Streptomyces sp. XD-27]WKX73944.1 ABC transporter substrate-binding protein [Streptomyces sp. XD-27]
MTRPALVPPAPPSRWRLWTVLGLVLAVAVAVGTVRLVDARRESARTCSEGVVKRGPGDECVGVTDGRFVFSEALREVSEKIRAENRRVAESGEDWVAVAYTEPMTRRGDTAGNDRGPDVVRQAVEGAYLAQMELNHQGGHGRTPQIKLLLANSGQGGEQWRPLVDQLIGMKGDGDHRLVAVAGFGQSLATTESAVRALRGAGVPMVGSTVAADRLATPRPTFFRVSSPNRDQASIAADYLKRRQRDPGYRIDVIKDIKDDDAYNESLDEDFERAAAAEKLRLETADGYPFVSGSSSAATALATIAETVCRPERRLDAVYFAGRGRELKLLVEALTAPAATAPSPCSPAPAPSACSTTRRSRAPGPSAATYWTAGAPPMGSRSSTPPTPTPTAPRRSTPAAPATPIRPSARRTTSPSAGTGNCSAARP